MLICPLTQIRARTAHRHALHDRICVGTRLRDSIVLRMITLPHYRNLSRCRGCVANELFNRRNEISWSCNRQSHCCIGTYERNVLFHSGLYKSDFFSNAATRRDERSGVLAVSEEQSYLVSLQIAWPASSSVKVRGRPAQVRNAGGHHRVTANTLISIPCKEGIMRVPQFSEPSGSYTHARARAHTHALSSTLVLLTCLLPTFGHVVWSATYVISRRHNVRPKFSPVITHESGEMSIIFM